MPRFIKGQSGNKNGRPKMDPELLAVTKMSHAYITAIINKYSYMNRGDIKRAMEDAETSMIECTIASILVKAMQTGDYMKLNFLLDRAIGKVSEQLEVKSSHTVYSTTFTPDNNLIQQIMDGEEFEKLKGEAS